MKIKKFNKLSNVIGMNVRKYRELNHLSQRDVSNKVALLGVDLYSSDISLIENNKLLVKDFEILALCKVLNISVAQIFEGTEDIFL